MEHEISGHSRKVYKIWRNPALPFWKKFKEISVEILIIVFAVSLAAFLEREREHSNEQKDVKSFLLGLRTDLKKDISEMENDKLSYNGTHDAFAYLLSIKPGQSLSEDSLSKYQSYLFRTTGLVPNDGRFQGFKSSGKLSTIENDELENDILDLYQENITGLLSSTDAYTRKKEVFFNYLLDETKTYPDGSTNRPQLLQTDKALNTARILVFTQEILNRYDAVINKSRKIIAAIEKEYHIQ